MAKKTSALDKTLSMIVIIGSVKDVIRSGVKAIVGFAIPGETGKLIAARNLARIDGMLVYTRALGERLGMDSLVEASEELIDKYDDLIAKTL